MSSCDPNRRRFSPELQRLHDRRKELLVARSHLESRLQEQYGTYSLYHQILRS
jgi:hypothetical protein